ncbi:MAG TPA: transglutaminase domain-containing protein, partial [Candidatus Cloacimonadota bacterium]|nr:transglutaminase domain-containing protein [Candidatus Cloacimonadota bacterium]
MKRVAFILILLHLLTGLFAFLPSSLSRQGNPVLYERLMPKAKANIKQLPAPQRKQYKKLLKQYDDILMAYLIAYESNATLAPADPDDLFSNYRELRLYLDKEGLHYLPEIFLSYVAKQSVSDEPLTAYRKAMLDDGLREVLDGNSDILQRYRATASWCVEKLKFQQTSGRDQSPLDITQKSLVGRCEEMQILFVAAARTVGIPARPASTPWWAHIDNNHAWAEVYLNGEWAYTGDMDAAYHPNQTWFSGLIDKTVLILADGSMPTPQDEILAEGDYDVLINSTRNYAKERTREIKVSVTDESGQAVDNAIVSVLVFNWGSLRTLSSLFTDNEGNLKFSAGRGAFYLSAYKDGKQALAQVESDTLSTVTVKL